ncbi:hypothetical protein [Legionella yabuuchiae]|uniref:hypothetical protein n=1 Tax=Legionella yabuuchiae TaxID=376727 RepID=UPI0010556EA5|nr:hypothetical protein [Legionella yabuuchiae]
MGQPRILGYLNNCGLHLITPELTAEIIKYATNKDYDNQHNDAYQLLKDCFADFYEFDKATFTWEEFNKILARYNPFEIQIVLGPVLRLFMELKRPPADKLILPYPDEADLMGLTTIMENGRYRNLDPEEIVLFVTQHLGFSIVYQKEGQPPRRIDVDKPIADVYMYHQDALDLGHWERTNDPREINGKDGLSVFDCDQFQDIALKLGEGQAHTTLEALEDLRSEVNSRHTYSHVKRHLPSQTPNYSFLLKAGAVLASVLCVAAFATAVLAFVGLIVIAGVPAIAATSAFALAGLGAGVCAYGLFKSAQPDKPTIELEAPCYELI